MFYAEKLDGGENADVYLPIPFEMRRSWMYPVKRYDVL